MKDIFSIFGFVGVLILFAFVAGNGSGTTLNESGAGNTDSYISGNGTETQQEQLTPQEMENRVAELYQQLDELKGAEREKKLWGTPSPYRDFVELSAGNTWSTDPETEYLTLRTSWSGTNSLTISDWYLESYVTDERAGIPQGDRIIEKWRSPSFEDIILTPGEEALIITGDSPLDTSFRENICTGYLNEEEDFIPQLGTRCVSPMDELERYGRIKLDNDKCYDFVEQLGTCQIPDDSDVPRGSCTSFSDDTFNYNSCVQNHRNDPFFTRDGYWYVYLGRNDELWRSEREIIRLIDENNRVVDVLEY